MRLDSKTPPKKPLRQFAKPARKLPPKPHGVSWWALYAAPDQREQFIAAARARNAEMLTNHEWHKHEKLGQIAQI